MRNWHAQWTILVLGPTTDEADLRRMCANKLRGKYVIDRARRNLGNDRVESVWQVAVVRETDVEAVQSFADVIDKEFSDAYGGEPAYRYV